MRVALAIVLVGLGTVIFHVASPWGPTPLASNWGFIDTTIEITFWITGIAFTAVVLFLGYCAWRYRHRQGHKAHYEPESKALEVWLSVGTAVGVVALLTPGLFAWADYTRPPDDAMQMEVVGEQWRWSYRHPGEDGEFGATSVEHMGPENPFGIAPEDPAGSDDILIASGGLHLPIDQPVELLLRSKDVIHNFYVPHFRAKMDLLPGMVSNMWFTPTRKGEFEVLCAELCGQGHYAMRDTIVVESEQAYQDWLDSKPTFAETMGEADADAGEAAGEAKTVSGEDLVAKGRKIAKQQGCLTCHSLDGSDGVGPTWQGTWGSQETLQDGSTVTVDAAYIRESITKPRAKVVQGYNPVMPPMQLSDEQIEAIIALIKEQAE